jgi:hypothetical protein
MRIQNIWMPEEGYFKVSGITLCYQCTIYVSETVAEKIFLEAAEAITPLNFGNLF